MDDAESATGKEITDVVITVPAYFNNAQRVATEDAARIAGVHMIVSINDWNYVEIYGGYLIQRNANGDVIKTVEREDE